MSTESRHVEQLLTLVGEELRTNEWQQTDQDQVNLLADATPDHQWIHVDPEGARSGPFAQTVAHDFLTLALLPALLQPLLQVEGARLGVNYGLNRVRLPAPVPVGARIRARACLKEAIALEVGVQIAVEATAEIEGAGLQGQGLLAAIQRGAEQPSRERTRGPQASARGPRSTIAGLLQTCPTRGRRRQVEPVRS